MEGVQALFNAVSKNQVLRQSNIKCKKQEAFKKREKKKKRKKSFVKMVLADRLQFSLFPAVAKTTSLCTSGAQKTDPGWMVNPPGAFSPGDAGFGGPGKQGGGRGAPRRQLVGSQLARLPYSPHSSSSNTGHLSMV